MDETTKSIIDRITIRYQEPVKIPTGQTSCVFYDCIQLSPNELARLAAEAIGHLEQDTFDIAVGIAYNGIFFASAIAGGRQVAILQTDGSISGPNVSGKRVVIVDDVVHSGDRMNDAETKLLLSGAIVVGAACIIDRSDGSYGTSDKPLWSAYQMNMI